MPFRYSMAAALGATENVTVPPLIDAICSCAPLTSSSGWLAESAPETTLKT